MGHGFAQVAVNIPLDRAFDYEIPERLAGAVRPGVVVRVPFGPRSMTGYCVGTSEAASFHRTKPILAVLEAEPVFDANDLELARWIASEYAAGIGEVLEAMLPSAVRQGKARPATEFAKLVTPGAGEPPRGAKQAAVVKALAELGGEAAVSQVLEKSGASRASLLSLVEAGLVAIEKREVDPWSALRAAKTEPHDLTPPQREALSEIVEAAANRRFQPFLLFGVTGSGKTEVYLRAIDHVVRAGGQAIVLIPEIVLTPQTVARFVGRFDRVAVLHSHLSAQERHAQWRAIARGDAQVVVGARSAVFAPARKLGIIVIDEEHETSFKQENAPRYHAREVAMRRARIGNFPVVLGSATPSLESFYRAENAEYRMLQLPQRVESRPMPAVEVVSMVEERAIRKGRHVLSRRLEQLLREALARGEQTMLFLNRRGFTTHLFCPTCGWTAHCEHCSISLIHHKDEQSVVCHYCGHRTTVPDACPDCKGTVVQIGMGTERIEEEVKGLYPDAAVERIDGDTMSKAHAHEGLFDRVHSGEVDVLVGTQLLAKGHDFPDVTVVGVVSADTGLHFPDFRARERTFQLLTQVAGRTGRSDKGGRVVVQTYNPAEPSVSRAAQHDYVGFARAELADRNALGYPPYTRLVRIVVEGVDGAKVTERAQEIAGALGAAVVAAGGKMLGPVPAPISRIKGRFRSHLILRLALGTAPGTFVDLIPGRSGRKGGIAVGVDVDPVSML